MEDLVVKSTSIVHRRSVLAEPNRVKKIHLIPWDILGLRNPYPQRGLFFPKPDPKITIDSIVSKLKASLSIALDQFYPLAGCLVKQVNENNDSVSYYISCDGGGSSGVKFIYAEAKAIGISDLVKYRFRHGLFGSFFFPATGIKNYQGVSNPLLMVQVTELKDGILISYGYNHIVADGKSIWKFINAWSKICRMNNLGFEPTDLILLLDRIEYPIHNQDLEIEQATLGTLDVVKEIVFRLTKENVLKLKDKANYEFGYEGEGKISSLQAALGHIWHSRVKNSDMNREEETHCSVPIDMRQRLIPKLKEDCFGNVIQICKVTINVGELLDRGIGWAALKINRMVRLHNDEDAKAFAENLVKNVKNPGYIRWTLDVTSSPRFDVYGNDFGWGKPIALRSGPPYDDGKLMVVQRVEEGGLEFQACFPAQVVVKLVKDAEFLEFVDIVS